jgi:hypothetical protein
VQANLIITKIHSSDIEVGLNECFNFFLFLSAVAILKVVSTKKNAKGQV